MFSHHGFLLITVALGTAGRLAAEPIAPVCASAGLSTYLASGFACQIGDMVFQNFKFNTRGSFPPSSGSVQVTPIGTDPLGLSFGSWSAPPPWITNQVWIRYTATLAPGSATGVDRVLASAPASGIFGSAEVQTHLCAGGGFSGTPNGSGGLGGLTCASPAGSYQSGSFSPFYVPAVSGEIDLSAELVTIGVVDYVRLTGGLLDWTALLSTANRFYVITPEPSSAALTLVGACLLLVGGWRRRRRAAKEIP